MKSNPNDPLETWAKQALRQMPDRRAPAGLSRRVLAEIQRREAAPWYSHPWMEWSPLAKLASAVSLPALGFVVWGTALPALRDAIVSAPMARNAATTLQTASAMGETATSLGRAGWITVSHVNPSYLAIGAAIFAVAWFSTLGLGTAAWRLARNND